MMSKRNFYLLAAIACLAGYGWLCYAWMAGGDGLSVCLFKRMYHMPCPACGSTRAAMEILQDHWAEAFRLNPLGYVCVVALGLLPVWLLHDLCLRHATLYAFYRRAEKALARKKVFIGLMLLVILNWAWILYNDV